MTDLNIGAEKKKEFEEHLKSLPNSPLGKMEFSVQVLTTGYWPTYKDFPVRLPPLLAKVSCFCPLTLQPDGTGDIYC